MKIKTPEVAVLAEKYLWLVGCPYKQADANKLEKEIMRTVNRALRCAGYASIRDWQFEPESVEHGVVDIFYAECQATLRINPNTGLVLAL